MVIGFRKQFVEPIEDFFKVHTIRQDKSNRWSEGKIMHMATGVRTKNYHCFYQTICTGTQAIEIKWEGKKMTIRVDNKELSMSQMTDLAHNDGFHSLVEFEKWFNADFKGKIIHWSAYRY